MEALGINPGYLLMQIFGITVLTLLLNRLAYQPILGVLEERQKRIAKGLEDARQAAVARDNAEAEAKKVIEAARAEAGKVRAEAVSAAEAQAKEVETQAREQARGILAQADADAEERRNGALADMRGQIASISIAAANKLVGEALDEKRQHGLINSFFAKVPSGVSSLRGSSAEVTSALPLTEGEQAAARKAISASNITFKVDPSIMGGLIVRVGDRIVDSSVAGQMNGMRDSLSG
ncbi:MAG: F0F1 ATP synthase subunit B [Candidatus Promineifilaceae bacterium]